MKLLYSIPERYEDGFQELDLLSSEDFEHLKKILGNIKWTYSIDNLTKSVYKEIKTDIDIEEIFESVGSLIPFIDKEEMIGQLVEDIVEILNENEDFEVTDIELLKAKLTYLLNSKHIYYASKSESLIENYGNVYIQSKILSDIRPVFDIELNNPQAGFVIHTMCIHYQSNEEPYHKDISIQLTSSQIQDLRDALDRAEKKESILKSVLSNSNVQNLIY